MISSLPSNQPKMISAQSIPMEYKSYDQVVLNLGDSVYQIAYKENTFTPVLIKYTVQEKMNDGRIKITGQYITSNMTEERVLTTHPSACHTNPVKLLQEWLVMMKHKLEIELPEIVQGIENELLKLQSENVITNIQVGQGLNKETEI